MTNYSIFDDTQLLGLLKVADPGAYAEIYTRYNEVLLYWTQIRIKSFNATEVILGDIFTDLWFNQSSFDFSKGLRSALISAIYKRIVRYHTKEVPSEEFTASIVAYLAIQNKPPYQELATDIISAHDKEIEEIRIRIQSRNN